MTDSSKSGVFVIRENRKDALDIRRPIIDFEWSDAWLLFSIAMADEPDGADLRSIIAVGDWINHAIFTGPELRRGLAKLIHAGHVSANRGRFSLAGAAKVRWAACKQKHKYPARRMKDLEEFLGITPPSPTNSAGEASHWDFPEVTDEMIYLAYQEYIGKDHGGK